MRRLLSIINSKESSYILLSVNLILFAISFKQLFWEGKEAIVLELNHILLLPFIYAYSTIIIFFMVFTFQKKSSIFLKIFGLLCIVGIMMSPIKLLEKGGFEIFTLPIFLALLEVFRNSDAFNKQLLMLIVTFLFLFISALIAKIFDIETKQWCVYAVLYYLYIACKEYMLLKNYSKVD